MEQTTQKELRDLNLIDNFLFGSVVTHPEIGEDFGRSLLEIILGRKLNRLTVMPQKVYYGSDCSCHGAVLDVYLEETPDKAGEKGSGKRTGAGAAASSATAAPCQLLTDENKAGVCGTGIRKRYKGNMREEQK